MFIACVCAKRLEYLKGAPLQALASCYPTLRKERPKSSKPPCASFAILCHCKDAAERQWAIYGAVNIANISAICIATGEGVHSLMAFLCSMHVRPPMNRCNTSFLPSNDEPGKYGSLEITAQRLCQRCNLHALHDERHLVFECPAMQCVRDRYPALFSPATNTMQLFMWQHDIVGVAHFIQDCFEVLGALDDAPDDASTSSSSALAAG